MLGVMQSASHGRACPNCGEQAPVVLQGLTARCTACGAERPPFAVHSVTFAGQPAKFGGVAATLVGWLVLVLGLSLALLVGLLLQSIWPASFVGWAFGVPIAALTLFFGVLLLLGGRRLRQHGGQTRRSVQLAAIRALVAHRGGSVTTAEAARALDVTEAEADALLTEFAKDAKASVSVDVDDQGVLRYDFDREEKRWRVLDETQAAAPDAVDEVAHAPEIVERLVKR
jgi:glucose dehydrogenase